jgi:hypothetical protein
MEGTDSGGHQSSGHALFLTYHYAEVHVVGNESHIFAYFWYMRQFTV